VGAAGVSVPARGLLRHSDGSGTPVDPQHVYLGRGMARLQPTLSTGLLGRLWRPSVARTAWSLEWLSGGLRPRCSGERRPPSKPEEPASDALPVECPVATLCGRSSVVGFLYRHNVVPGTSRWGAISPVPWGAAGRRDRAPRALPELAHTSGRAVFDQSAAADRRSGWGAGSADCQRGHSTGSPLREAHAEAGGSL
jgi:hypothetical protein